MAKNLKNTLLIEGTEYNINAVHSDTADNATNATKSTTAATADKVQKALTITEALTSGDSSKTFDGSTAQTIKFVPSSGGKYEGEVLINNKYTSTTVVPDQAIINSEQINERVRELTGAPLYIWNNSSQLSQAEVSTGKFHRINTVVGTAENLETFKKLIGTPDPTSTKKSTAYYGVKLATNNNNCVVNGYEDCGYTNVIIPYIGFISYSGSNTDYASIIRTNGRPVVSIQDKAFDVSSASTTTAKESLRKIESVLIPASVTAIGSYAFRGCTGLKSIVIPSSVTRINTDAFSGCTGLATVYYDGTDADWANITIGSGNSSLTSASRVAYNESPDTVDFKEIVEKPLLYICADALDASTEYANKIFLKLPNDFSFIELSKGATRLDSTINANINGYYTYESLAEIIARINLRLEGIAGTDAAIQTPAYAPLPEIDVDFDPDAVPTVQQLQNQLTGLTGKTEKDTPVADTVLKAQADENGRNISTGYYQSENTGVQNTIKIVSSIPTDSTVGNVGDICIVINTNG